MKPFSRPGKRNNWSSQSFAYLTLGLVSIFPHPRQHPRSGLNIHEIILLEKEKRTKGQDAWRADADLRWKGNISGNTRIGEVEYRGIENWGKYKNNHTSIGIFHKRVIVMVPKVWFCYLRNNFISEQTIYHSESEICNNISREDSIICQLVWLNWFCTKIGNPKNQ